MALPAKGPTPESAPEESVFLLRAESLPSLTQAMESAGIAWQGIGSLGEVAEAIRAGRVAALVAPEQALETDPEALEAALEEQPPWSDLPLVIWGRDRTPVASLAQLGLTLYVPPPPESPSLLSAIQIALRIRRQQHLLRALLEERVQASEALARQSEELARSYADLQQFAYVTSHDLQEPLRTIASFLQLLQKRHGSKLEPEANEYIDYALKGAQRLSALIQDLLAYSRVVNRVAQSTRVELSSVLEWAKQNLQAAIEETGAVIESQPLPCVSGDHVLLVQLFQNLLSNAMKYRSSEPPHIRIGAEWVGDHWRIRVSDNGLGIDRRYHKRIFELFQRVHGPKFPGTGMGLAICKKIVERHSGEIWVESEPGKGSTFFFTLPPAPQANPSEK